MDGFDGGTITQVILFFSTIIGAVVMALWLGMMIWTYRDMRQRSRDTVGTVAAVAMVGVLNVAGLILYLMLRPRETLTEAYERSLEEESLLQGIEEKPVCPSCGRPANSRWQVCPHCHTRLKKPCVECGELLELPWNLCPYCATPQPAIAGEARQVVDSQPPRRSSRARTRQGPPTDQNLEFVDE
jgi:RNA polymerase subunit RPABC4/transcription elongation factor Spt4